MVQRGLLCPNTIEIGIVLYTINYLPLGNIKHSKQTERKLLRGYFCNVNNYYDLCLSADYRAILTVQYHFLLHGKSGGFAQSDWLICFTLIIIYNY